MIHLNEILLFHCIFSSLRKFQLGLNTFSQKSNVRHLMKQTNFYLKFDIKLLLAVAK